MSNCKICGLSIQLPVQLSCGHNFCYLCVKSQITSGIQCCHTCGIGLNIDAKGNILDSNELSNDRNIYWMYSVKHGNSWWCYTHRESNQLESMFNDYLIEKGILSATDKDAISIINNDIINNGNNHELIKLPQHLNNIKVSGMEFKIDFNKMNQININDNTKQRNIKRIQIKNNIPYADIINYLKHNYNVIGIAGIKF